MILIHEERKSFAATLRALRKKQGLTQHELADLLHVSRSTYSYYENGTNRPSYEALISLAKVFQVTTDFLLGKDDDSPQISTQKFYSYFANLSTMEQSRLLNELKKLIKER